MTQVRGCRTRPRFVSLVFAIHSFGFSNASPGCEMEFLNFGIGVVGCGEGIVYLASLGRPTYVGLQLGKTCIFVAGKGRGGIIFLLFLHFHSCSSFSPVPLFHLLC